MYLPLLGWHIGGLAGAIATTLPILAPSCTLTLLIARLHVRHPKGPLTAIRRGLTPITIGLVFASGWILMTAVNDDWRGYALTAATVLLVMRTSLNPLWLLGGGAALGIFNVV
jgi:chromate transporter